MGKRKVSDIQRIITFALAASPDTLAAAIDALVAVRDSRGGKGGEKGTRATRSDKGSTRTIAAKEDDANG
jgi:hypothetical protein